MLPERKSQTYKIYGDALIEDFVRILISAEIDFDVKAIWKEDAPFPQNYKVIDYYLLTIYDAIKVMNGKCDTIYCDPDIFPNMFKEEAKDD